MVLFDISPLLQFSKFGNFIWIYLILMHIFFRFFTPRLKTQQPVLPYRGPLPVEVLTAKNSPFFFFFTNYSDSHNLVILFEHNWFWHKNIFNFIAPPAWKLHNPYCHTELEPYLNTTVSQTCKWPLPSISFFSFFFLSFQNYIHDYD